MDSFKTLSLKRVIAFFVAFLFVVGSTGCSGKSQSSSDASNKTAESQENTKEALKEAGSISAFLRDNPDMSEDDFWSAVEANYPITPFQDVYDRTAEKQEVLVDAIVASCKSNDNKKYDLTLLCELADKSYVGEDLEIDQGDPYSKFKFGGDELKQLNTDDQIRICFYTQQSNGLSGDTTYAIKKIGHEDGIVNKILNGISQSSDGQDDSSNSTISEQDQISSSIRSRVSDKYNKTTVDSITVNEDTDTDTPNDYVVLVNLTWNVENKADTTKKMLQTYSDDLAAYLVNEYGGVGN